MPCRLLSQSSTLLNDFQRFMTLPALLALRYNLRAVLHHQQLDQLILQGRMLSIQSLPASHQLSLLLLPLLNGNLLGTGDSVPFLQHPPRRWEGPQMRRMGCLELLPATFPVDAIQLFHNRLHPQKGFSQPDHLVQVADLLGAGTHLILQAAGLAGDAIQRGFQVAQRFDVMLGQAEQCIGKLFCIADPRLFASGSDTAFLIVIRQHLPNGLRRLFR